MHFNNLFTDRQSQTAALWFFQGLVPGLEKFIKNQLMQFAGYPLTIVLHTHLNFVITGENSNRNLAGLWFHKLDGIGQQVVHDLLY